MKDTGEQSHKSIVHLSLTEPADKREGGTCPAEVTPECYFKCSGKVKRKMRRP
jgi:hypothetical protein